MIQAEKNVQKYREINAWFIAFCNQRIAFSPGNWFSSLIVAIWWNTLRGDCDLERLFWLDYAVCWKVCRFAGDEGRFWENISQSALRNLFTKILSHCSCISLNSESSVNDKISLHSLFQNIFGAQPSRMSQITRNINKLKFCIQSLVKFFAPQSTWVTNYTSKLRDVLSKTLPISFSHFFIHATNSNCFHFFQRHAWCSR